MIEKPTKLIIEVVANNALMLERGKGYNDACDAYDAWLKEFCEKDLIQFFCDYHNCSDGNGEQYPKCNMAFKNKCPQITKPARAISNRLKEGVK